ncbi:hypothetical protein EKK58_06820 [Candidatus Dependentiae bacterium]|nr:MAG: hypothetical protein EKK58_06820 [Candidatus Dependentiae bacterium]
MKKLLIVFLLTNMALHIKKMELQALILPKDCFNEIMKLLLSSSKFSGDPAYFFRKLHSYALVCKYWHNYIVRSMPFFIELSGLNSVQYACLKGDLACMVNALLFEKLPLYTRSDKLPYSSAFPETDSDSIQEGSDFEEIGPDSLDAVSKNSEDASDSEDSGPGSNKNCCSIIMKKAYKICVAYFNNPSKPSLQKEIYQEDAEDIQPSEDEEQSSEQNSSSSAKVLRPYITPLGWTKKGCEKNNDVRTFLNIVYKKSLPIKIKK